MSRARWIITTWITFWLTTVRMNMALIKRFNWITWFWNHLDKLMIFFDSNSVLWWCFLHRDQDWCFSPENYVKSTSKVSIIEHSLACIKELKGEFLTYKSVVLLRHIGIDIVVNRLLRFSSTVIFLIWGVFIFLITWIICK